MDHMYRNYLELQELLISDIWKVVDENPKFIPLALFAEGHIDSVTMLKQIIDNNKL